MVHRKGWALAFATLAATGCTWGDVVTPPDQTGSSSGDSGQGGDGGDAPVATSSSGQGGGHGEQGGQGGADFCEPGCCASETWCDFDVAGAPQGSCIEGLCEPIGGATGGGQGGQGGQASTCDPAVWTCLAMPGQEPEPGCVYECTDDSGAPCYDCGDAP